MDAPRYSDDLSYHADKIGASPGDTRHVEPATTPPEVQIITFDERTCEDHVVHSLEATLQHIDPDRLTWINVEDVRHPELVEQLGRRFDLHPLTIEDVVTPGQRPKVDIFDHYIYVVLQMLRLDGERNVVSEQVSLVIGNNYLLSFQEEIPGDVFDPIRQRLQLKTSRLRRTSGPDYLGYTLIDIIVDQYFVIAETISENIEDLQEQLLESTEEDLAHEINMLRHNLTYVRKWIWPLRNVLSHLEGLEHPLIAPSTRPYFRDAYDHAVQVIDFVSIFHETLGGLLDLYQSITNNRLSEIMKVLTIIGTIFIPLTFIAGVYGMNFEYMPELEWRYGYPALLGFMLVVALGLLSFFRRKEWI